MLNLVQIIQMEFNGCEFAVYILGNDRRIYYGINVGMFLDDVCYKIRILASYLKLPSFLDVGCL